MLRNLIFVCLLASFSNANAQAFTIDLPLFNPLRGELLTGDEIWFHDLSTGPQYFLDWVPAKAGMMVDSIESGALSSDSSVTRWSHYQVSIDSAQTRYDGYTYYEDETDNTPDFFHFVYNGSGKVGNSYYINTTNRISVGGVSYSGDTSLYSTYTYNADGSLANLNVLNSKMRPDSTVSINRVFYRSSIGRLDSSVTKTYDGELLNFIHYFYTGARVDSAVYGYNRATSKYVSRFNYNSSSELSGYTVVGTDGSYHTISYTYNVSDELIEVERRDFRSDSTTSAIREAVIYYDPFGNIELILHKRSFSFTTYIKFWYKEVGIGIPERRAESQFVIYPNPTTGVITLQAPFSIEELRVFTPTGEEVLSRQFTNAIMELELQLPDLEPAVYILRIIGDDNSISYQRVVVE